jgi:hypothetical protein
MMPAAINMEAAAGAVVVSRSADGIRKATVEQAAVKRWLPLVQENKPAILAALAKTAAGSPLGDPVAEARRQRVLAMLDARPGIRYAVTDLDADPEVVIVTLAVRGRTICELRVPRKTIRPCAVARADRTALRGCSLAKPMQLP